MREIKAFIHRNRIADVVHALHTAGYEKLSVIDVQGLLHALNSQEQRYSVEIGAAVITEVKLEIVCMQDERVPAAVEIIREQARTGQTESGWIYVSNIDSATPIED